MSFVSHVDQCMLKDLRSVDGFYVSPIMLVIIEATQEKRTEINKKNLLELMSFNVVLFAK